MQLPPAQVPTMGIWSTGDIARTEVQLTDSAETWRALAIRAPGRPRSLDAAGGPDQINALLLDFLPLLTPAREPPYPPGQNDLRGASSAAGTLPHTVRFGHPAAWPPGLNATLFDLPSF